MVDPLEFTGERFTPECVREIRYEHLHRYALATELVAGAAVLDAACGEGYGSQLLARRADTVIGVDLAADAVAHAAARYRAGNLSFQVADCCALPFRDAQFDAVVSFETLEHVADQERLLAEFRRVLAPGGFLAISSPDRAIYSDRLGNRNPYHVRELYLHELQALLATYFPAVRLLGQRLGFHSLIWPLGDEDGSGGARSPGVVVQREGGESVSQRTVPAGDPVYFIALCAARAEHLPVAADAVWLFDDDAESVYHHYHHEIRKNMQAGELLQERDRRIEALEKALDVAHAGSPDSPTAARRPWWRRLFDRS